MAYVFINDNKVVEKLDCDEEYVETVRHLYQQVINTAGLPRDPKVGWLFDNVNLKPDIKPVTPRQIRQAWILMGKSLSEIDNAINTLPEPSRSLARVEWEYSTTVFRSNKLVSMLGQMQGYSEDALDGLWILAGSIP